jgi:class 3 adenylate cyclase/CHASE2 domain-containing sensor protein
MNRTEKRLLRRTIELGLALTLVVIVLDWVGLLQPFARYLYDRRARYCQFFSPAPSDKIVHLDINDETLESIGWWPWPRAKLAMLMEEIRLAGPKIVGFDVVFTEAQPVRLEKTPDGADRIIEDDKAFADSIGKAGNVLIPLSIDPQEATDPPIVAAMIELFKKDLEIDRARLKVELRGTKFDTPQLNQDVDQHFLAARQQAMFERVMAAVSGGESDLNKLREQLTPGAWAADVRSDVVLLLTNTLPRVQSVLRLKEFTQPIPPDLPPMLTSDKELATIAPLAEAAAYCGFVDFVQEGDGVVRSVPLYVNYRGRLLPHMLLVSTCALLDVKLSDVKITPDSVTIPVPDAPITIPVRTIHSAKFGRIGMFAAIPYFGRTDKWNLMYDLPGYSDSKQHLPLKSVWTICEFQRDIEENNRKAIDAIAFFMATMNPDEEKVQAFLKSAPSLTPEELEQKIRQTLDNSDVKDYVKMAQETAAKDRSEVESKLINSHAALDNALSRNARLQQRRAEARLQLRQQLSGRIVLVGWAATGKTDMYTTSLHPVCPGVAIQGVMINGILTRHLWTTPGWWVTVLCTAVIGITTTGIVALLPTLRALLITMLLIVGYAALNGLVFFDWGNGIVGAAGPITAAVVIWTGLTFARFVFEQRERSRVIKRFTSRVDPAIVNYVLENPDEVRFDGQLKEMTVVFTDLAGFTTISEKLKERTVPLLNEYMSRMMPIIRGNKATWNKFLGDGIMFYFNAPRDNQTHARDAVFTVLEMQKAMEPFNQRLFQRGLPHVAMRAGISTGMMIVGDAGSTDTNDEANLASDYTVLGDDVNLGARLESANKALGSRVLMNGRAAELLNGEFLVRPMGNIKVVGKTEGVETFEALCLTSEATDKQKSLVEMSTCVVERFKSAEFNQCIDAARKLEDTFGSSKFTQLYMHLSRQYLEAPRDWFDGQIVLVEK